MDKFSPKIEIINHFDKLINRVDIDIEKSLEKYNEEQVLSQLNCFDIGKRKVKSLKNFSLKCFDPNDSSKQDIEYQTVDEWPESTKVVDYLNQIRKRTIDELTKVQEDSLKNLKLNSSQFKSIDIRLIDEKKMDEIRSEIFYDKFYFQVLYQTKDPKFVDPWIFNLFTFITDFYMSSTEIALLETFINSSQDNNEKDIELSNQVFVFDEKMILIGLLQKQFFDNLKTQKFPSHVIIVRKEDILHIKQISCTYLNGVNLTSTTIDLSKLHSLYLRAEKINSAEIKIEGLSSLISLTLSFYSLDQVTIKDLLKLTLLNLDLNIPINSEVLFEFNDYLPNIETLQLNGELSNFSLDSFSNLKSLNLFGQMMDDFNFNLLDNICNQLEEICIGCSIFDNKLFYGRNFPYLSCLFIIISHPLNHLELEKIMFHGFPMLQRLYIFINIELKIIDYDVFSNLKQLNTLSIVSNGIKSIDNILFSNLSNLKSLCLSFYQPETIDENCFSSLVKLECLKLSSNKLESLDPKLFVGLKNLKNLDLSKNQLSHFDLGILDNIRQIEEIDLSGNPIINKEEILSHSLSSKIKFII